MPLEFETCPDWGAKPNSAAFGVSPFGSYSCRFEYPRHPSLQSNWPPYDGRCSIHSTRAGDPGRRTAEFYLCQTKAGVTGITQPEPHEPRSYRDS
jgi:hypothetical protein